MDNKSSLIPICLILTSGASLRASLSLFEEKPSSPLFSTFLSNPLCTLDLPDRFIVSNFFITLLFRCFVLLLENVLGCAHALPQVFVSSLHSHGAASPSSCTPVSPFVSSTVSNLGIFILWNISHPFVLSFSLFRPRQRYIWTLVESTLRFVFF